ncbi:MAG: diacylglycerol kinase family lipid kinase [Ruminococcus sp.]|jgi:YegS/Rv2252/BmrU family lipid kinase|nr:diacylglycerol kinase family lipid kinase [Ruminococcus sp.]
MERTIFIINPVAGKGAAERFKEKLSGEEVYLTKYPHHATEIVKDLARSGEKFTVYAVGGDGTLNEVICGIDGNPNITCGIIPAGTGNDFYKTLETMPKGEVFDMDLIETSEGKFGLNICSVGFDSDVAAGMRKFKWAGKGKLPYFLSLLNRLIKPVYKEYEVTIDGKNYDGEYSMITVCNGTTYGGGFIACPDAVPNDGKLEILLTKGITRIKLFSIIKRYSSGRYKELSDVITHVQGKDITIKHKEGCNFNADGEMVFKDCGRFFLSQKKVKVIH